MTTAQAVVMNMFYTGVGIARSLGERGVRVAGLSAQRGIYGEYTRYARIVAAPDSRRDPGGLLDFLLRYGAGCASPPVIFPTRDDDLVFLDRHRAQLAPYFRLAIPDSAALRICLDKWETHERARRAGIAAPRCWRIGCAGEFEKALEEITYPCVLKPLEAHHWRQGNNWALVDGRKAIPAASREELAREYAAVARADERALVEELVPGGDTCLRIAACYFDRQSQFVAGFNTQKVLQVPEQFGTGCIVQTAAYPELFDPTIRLLREIGFTGVAEVEYKWDAARHTYQLIEINPRLWDQHRLGRLAGVDLAYLAYCENAGLPIPTPKPSIGRSARTWKWIAEDAFLTEAARRMWRREGGLRALWQLPKGRRTYAIWSVRDPVPFLAYMGGVFLPALLRGGLRQCFAKFRTAFAPASAAERKTIGI